MLLLGNEIACTKFQNLIYGIQEGSSNWKFTLEISVKYCEITLTTSKVGVSMVGYWLC